MVPRRRVFPSELWPCCRFSLPVTVPGLLWLGFLPGDEAGFRDAFGFAGSRGSTGGLSSAIPSLGTGTHCLQVMVCKICQPSDLPLTIPCPPSLPLHRFHSKPFLVTNLFSGVWNTNQLPSPLNRATLNSAAEITGFCQHRDIKCPEWPSPRSVYPRLQLPLRAPLREGGKTRERQHLHR